MMALRVTRTRGPGAGHHGCTGSAVCRVKFLVHRALRIVTCEAAPAVPSGRPIVRCAIPTAAPRRAGVRTHSAVAGPAHLLFYDAPRFILNFGRRENVMLMVYMHRDASRARRGSSRDRGEVGEPRRTTCARDRPRRERPSLENGWISLIKQGLEGVHTP